MPIIIRSAKSEADKQAVYKLRHQVFVEEEHRLPHLSCCITDPYDALEESINLIAIEGEHPVGAIRLTIDNAIGMPARDLYDFHPLIQQHSGKFASVGWLCIADRFRSHHGIFFGLIRMMVREARKKGVKHLIASLHPPVLPLLERFGAKAVDSTFFSEKLQVEIVPIHVDLDKFPPGYRESFMDPLAILFDDSNERRIYRKGEKIVERGVAGSEAFVVMRGTVEVLDCASNNERLKAQKNQDNAKIEPSPLLGPGQVFGESSLLDNAPCMATVICHSKEADLMVWNRQQFFEQLKTDSAKAIQLCRILSKRLRIKTETAKGDNRVKESLIASILVNASGPDLEPVNLGWLALQCGMQVKHLTHLIDRWVNEGILSWYCPKSIAVNNIKRLKEKVDWR